MLFVIIKRSSCNCSMLDAHTVTVQGLVQYLVIAELLFEIYHLGFNTNSILCHDFEKF